MKPFTKIVAIVIPLLAAELASGQTLFIPDGSAGVGTSTTGFVGVNVSAPVDRFQINATRPILIGYNGGNGVYGSHIGFNLAIDTGVVPNTVTKLGGTNQQGGAIVTVDHWGNYCLQTYNAGTENSSTINYAPQFTFSSSGSLGIGTNNPGATRLVVVSPQAEPSNTVIAEFSKHGSTNEFGSAIVRLSRALASESVDLELNSGGSGPFRHGSYADTLLVSNQNYSHGPYGSIHLVTNQASRITVGGGTLAGNVGIGTTSPGQRLDINGITRMRDTHYYGSNDEVGMITWGSMAGGVGFGMMARNGRSLSFGANNQWDHVVVSTSGNVGIGTTSPSHKLAVNGTIKTKEVIVETTGWADDVFAPGYVLPTLDSVEQHIAEKGHLPGIPSAAEVAENGVAIGDMQAALLRKVEELTPHLLAQQREIESLKQRLVAASIE